MFYDHKKKEILDFIKECYQLTFDTTLNFIALRIPHRDPDLRAGG